MESIDKTDLKIDQKMDFGKKENLSFSDLEENIFLSEMPKSRKATAKKELSKYVHHFIPCFLHLPEKIVGNKMMVFFHANGEDIGLAFNFCDRLC